jgi:hypothetical protein
LIISGKVKTPYPGVHQTGSRSSISVNNQQIITAFTVPFETETFSWIGKFTFCWSQIEYLVEKGIYNLQGVSDADGRKLRLPKDITARSGKLKALAGDKCTDAYERKAFTALCDSVVELAWKRNLVVHGLWVRLSDHDHEPAAVSWLNVPIGEQIRKLSPAELPSLTIEAANISKQLYALLHTRGAFESNQGQP